jgi:hypothetical protein
VLGDLHEVTIHVPHFARLELGDSVAQEGLAGLIPVWIQSTANVEEFTFALSGLNDRITRLDMIGFGGTVCDRVVVKDGDTWVVWFKVCGQYPRLEYFLVGGLRFVTETGATGVFTVQVSDFAVFQSDNNLVGDLSTRGSKLTVFGDRPVLEIRRVSVEESALTIYASPGRNYVVLVQRSPLGAGPWEYFGEIWMEKSKYTFPPIPLDQSHVLFRAMVDPDSPP